MIIHVHQNVSQKAIASERHSEAPNPIENLAIFFPTEGYFSSGIKLVFNSI